ncbi:hypothetical protein ACR30L_06265 [Psychromonas sp. PT13]|uniref:hypothetical protein n=1 Tax=Psychromonas sp. PT13 TaxID=3439547 RepID=UPI003EBBC04F
MSEKQTVQVDQTKLGWSLFALRVGIFIVIGIWSLDKFFNPGHVAAVFSKFYQIDQLGEMTAYLMGTVQIILALLFVTGCKKNITYLLILIIHLASTLVSFPIYMSPFANSNLLFFAAWPMLGACIALYLLRDYDKCFCVK